MKNYNIAIDGPSGAGKSSLARRCAKHLGFIYVDTGAMYRTVGLAAYRAGVDRKNEAEVCKLFPDIHIEMKYDDKGEQRMYLNGEDVSGQIRTPQVSVCASDVSALPKVRQFLEELQQNMARNYSVLMDGRDIGTEILPNADVKIFLTASAQVRAQRRYKELQEKDDKSSFEDVLAGIEYRDKQDTERSYRPLRQAEDAVLIDTSELNFEESFEAIMKVISDKTGIQA